MKRSVFIFLFVVFFLCLFGPVRAEMRQMENSELDALIAGVGVKIEIATITFHIEGSLQFTDLDGDNQAPAGTGAPVSYPIVGVEGGATVDAITITAAIKFN